MENSWKLQSINKGLVLKENELHIWRTKVHDNIDNLNNYWYLLTQDEQIRAQEFYFVIDKNRYIIARAVLRKLIAGYIGISPKNILFEYTEYGKPSLILPNDNQKLKFNLAHSRDAIIYAITKNIDVGVDIEFVNKDFVIEDIIQHSCSEQEQFLLRNLFKSDKYNLFYELWVAKEAFVKAMGVGLSFDLKQIDINFSKNKLISATNLLNNSTLCWTGALFSAYNGFYSAFATINPVKRVFFLTYNN